MTLPSLILSGSFSATSVSKTIQTVSPRRKTAEAAGPSKSKIRSRPPSPSSVVTATVGGAAATLTCWPGTGACTAAVAPAAGEAGAADMFCILIATWPFAAPVGVWIRAFGSIWMKTPPSPRPKWVS